MACEACNVKFSLFKRKKQCADCSRHFCSECVIKRPDKTISCDSCSMLSRRPLVRSQVAQMRSKDLRQYLMAKNVCVKGCVEKEDLVSLLMLYANGRDDSRNEWRYSCSRPQTAAEWPMGGSPESSVASPSVEVDADPVESRTDEQAETERTEGNYIEIVEFSGSDSSTNDGPEPLITEHEDGPENTNSEQREEQHQHQHQQQEERQHRGPEMFTEIPVWSGQVKLSDINELSELEYLSVKQLKNLLSTNRVDYKGCIERSELLDRASRLWEEYKQSRIDVEKMDEENLCKICWDAPIECVILECGHMACCINCGKQMSECPICKQYVVRVVRLFKA